MEDSGKTTQFRIIRDGPVEITGNFTLKGSDGTIIRKDGPIYLCRCGKSGEMPFCDCLHKKKENF